MGELCTISCNNAKMPQHCLGGVWRRGFGAIGVKGFWHIRGGGWGGVLGGGGGGAVALALQLAGENPYEHRLISTNFTAHVSQ